MLTRLFVSKTVFSGLEIEGDYVKFAQAEDSVKGRRITSLTVKRIASPSEKEIVAAVKDIVNEIKGPLGHLTFCIPRHKATVRFLRFPSVNEKEIAGMVGLQSAKELPLHKEEMVSDYLITEQTRQGYTKVALVIVHQDVIYNYLRILKEAGLRPQRITFSTEALQDWYRKILAQEKFRGNSMLLDLDCNNLDIAIFDNSHLDFTRGLTFGASQLRNHPDLKNKLTQEVKRTIEGYARQEKAKHIQRILLSETAKELKDFLQAELNLPCEVVAPLQGLIYAKKGINLQYQFETSLIRILGVLLKGKRRLNLLPMKLQEEQGLIFAKKRTQKVAVLLLGIILLSFAVLANKLHNKNSQLFYINREIKRTNPIARDVENMLQEIEMIKRRGELFGSSVDVLRELHKLTPGNISLSSFDYDEEKGRAILQGNSANRSGVLGFIALLEKSVYFKNVQLKYAREKRTRAGDLIDFRIEGLLEQQD